MKKILILLTLGLSIVMLFSIISFSNKLLTKLTSPIPTIAPLPSEIPTKKPQINEIAFNGKTYQFHFHKIEKNETLDLIPNFEDATFSAQIMKTHSCIFGINGGFYKKEGGPLGLFFAGQKLLGEKIQSTTFNGFLTQQTVELEILNSPPLNLSQFNFVLQSGPLIFLQNEVQPNFIDRDYSRRHLIAKSATGDFYLFSIYEKDNKFNGPRLEDLRLIFLSPDFKTIADFELVLNLDGGSASAFYEKNIQIEEFKPIGSFLCGKKKY